MTFSIESFSDHLATLVESAGASLVRVEARRGRPGTGVVWSDGVIVTASHVVEDDERLEVVFADGKSVAATLAGRDPSTDLAVLKVPVSGLAAPRFTDLEGVRVGNLVLALARPGRTVRASLGIVSTLGDGFRTHGGGRVDRFLQASVDLAPGYSGGLLVDVTGRALGLVTAGLVRGAAMTIPTATIRRVASALLAEGGVRRGFLGIGSHPVRLPRALAEATQQGGGLIVLSVAPDSPAERAGLTLGDVLLALDGHELSSIGDLLELLDEERVGKEARLRIARGGEPRELTLTVGPRP